jgi:hypothetical protein
MAKARYLSTCTIVMGSAQEPIEIAPGVLVNIDPDNAEMQRLIKLGAFVEPAAAPEEVPAGGSVTSESGANVSAKK